MPDSQLTKADRLALQEVRDAITVAIEARKAAIKRRDALLCELRRDGVGVTELAREVELHRSQVNRIVTEQPTNGQD